ncbi:MAG: hypothetical protein ACRDYC_13550, partial [Acidimicrobiales bacterium]
MRIIGADEARARLDAGEAAGRRPDSELRFVDVPPAPSGPRPATRFPLPTSMDPSDLPRPRLAPRPATSGAAPMPHWADPATGEVPHIPNAQYRGGEDPDPWVASSGGGARWKGDQENWDDADDDFLALGDDDDEPVGVLDPTRSERSDLYSFEEDFERLEEERAARNYEGSREAPYEEPDDTYDGFEEPRRESRPLRARAAAPPAPRRGGPGGTYGEGGGGGGGRNLMTATVVGVALLVLLVVADAVGSRALVVLAAA